MSNTIILKKSSVSGNAPASGDLSLGEIAINYADGHLYYKSGASAAPVKINAGDADTTDGFHLNQDVRSTASPSFAALDINGAADVSGNLAVGEYILRSGQSSNYHRFLASRQIFVVGNTSSIDLNNGVSTFGATSGATTLQGSSLLLDSAGDITLDAGGQDIILSDDGTIFGTLSNSSGLQIRSRVNNADMLFRGVDGGTEFTALTLDMSEGGNATFAGSITTGGTNATVKADRFSGIGTGVVVGPNSNGTVFLRPAGVGSTTSQSSFTGTLATIGTNATVTGNVTATTFYGDGSNLTNLPSGADNTKLPLTGGDLSGPLSISNSSGNTLTLKKGTGTPAIALAGTSSEASALIEGIAGGGLTLYTSNGGTLSSPSWSPKMTVLAGGRVGIGTTTPDASTLLHVQGVIGTTNGSAAAPTHSFYGDPDNGMFRAAVNTLGFSTAGTERMRLAASGDVIMGNTVANIASNFNNQKGFGYKFSTGQTEIATTADIAALTLGRNLGSDGAILDLRKEGTVIGSFGSNTTGGQTLLDISASTSNGNMRFLTSGAEIMRINSSGNVGIGTTSPSGELHVSNISDFFTDLDGDDSAIVFKEAGGNPWRIGNKSSDDSFRITQDVGSLNTNPRFTIANGGNVGIGTTSPTNILHTYTSSNTVGRFESTDSDAHIRINDNADSLYVGTQNQKGYIGSTAANSSNNLTIDLTNGNVGIGTTSPSEKLDVAGSVKVGSYMKMSSSANYMGMIGFNRNVSTGAIYNSSYGAYQIHNNNGKLNLQVYNAAAGFVTAHVFDNSGNVGIGTTSPTQHQSANETVLHIADSNVASLNLDSTATNGDCYVLSSTGSGDFRIFNDDTNTTVLNIDDAGNVGIGTTSPSHKLEVGLTSSVALANQPAEPLFVSNAGNSVDGKVFISVKHDVVNTASAVGAGFKMTAAAVTSGTASYDDSLIFLESAGAGNDTIHSAPKAIKFYVDNHATNAGSGTNYGDLGDLALTIGEDTNATFAGSVTATSLIKSGGSSSEFLKADGSVDSSAYLTSLGTAIVDGDFTANGLMKRTGAGTYTSITDNSSNWNTAYTHTSATNNPHSVTKSQVGLSNVTNESKATMFTNAALTGNPTATTQSSSENSTKIATTAYVKSLNYITSANGGNAGTLDGYDSTQFLRSDANDTMAGTLTFSGASSHIALQENHVVFKRFDVTVDEGVSNSTTAYLLLCRNAPYNDVNGTVTMDRTSGLRHACSVDIVVSAGTGTNPAGTCRSIGTAGGSSPSYELVTLTYSSNSFIALKITNPDAYYETSGHYFTGRLATSDTTNAMQMIAPASVSSVSGFSSNPSHQIDGYSIFHDGYHPNADTLTTARNIALAGDVTGSVSFNGSGNVSITTSLVTNSVGSSEIGPGEVGASEIAANAVGASELNVSGNGTTAQFLKSDGDGTFTWATPSDTNTVYTHPTHTGDDISIDTGALTGATVISDLDFNITTNTLGHVTDANGTVATRTLTAANLGISAPNAPASASAAIVGNTVEVTFAASTTSNIDSYLVYSSIDGSDYGLISIVPPDDFAASMSIIDNAFDETGTQAYRVYAMKYGILSSATTASVAYTVSSAEPTTMSVVNLNNAYYAQWNPPSANARFVTAYNVYKHEHATQGSLSRSSASLIYSGMNTNYMYQISGTNNNNFHQFWVETTIA